MYKKKQNRDGINSSASERVSRGLSERRNDLVHVVFVDQRKFKAAFVKDGFDALSIQRFGNIDFDAPISNRIDHPSIFASLASGKAENIFFRLLIIGNVSSIKE